MGDIRTLDDLGDVAGRAVLVRLDLNVPMQDGEVTDASRIEMRDRGKAVLLVSVELDEIRSLADRILVMFDGTITGELAGEDADELRIGCLMAGVTEAQAA